MEKVWPLVLLMSKKLLGVILAPIYIGAFVLMYYTFSWYQNLWK